MAKSIDFTQVTIEWVEFRPDPTTGDAQLRAYGYLSNAAGDRIPKNIDGWDTVPDEMKKAVTGALQQLMAVRGAHELGVAPQDIATTLDIGPNYLKFKGAK